MNTRIPLALYISAFSILVSVLSFSVLANSITTTPFYTQTPPDASLIRVDAVNEFGEATIIGEPGAAASNATLVFVNLQTGQYRVGDAESDGSFSGELFAPPGTNIVIHQNLQGHRHHYSHSLMAATAIRSPVNNEINGAFSTTLSLGETQQQTTNFDDIPTNGQSSLARLTITGMLDSLNWIAGGSGFLSGELKLYSHNVSKMQLENVQVSGSLFLQRVFSNLGLQERPHPEAMSHVLTPTGLPIERRGSIDSIKIGTFSANFSSADNERSATTQWESNYSLPDNLPDGIYVLVFEASSNIGVFADLYYEDIEATYFTSDRYYSGPSGQTAWISQITVGTVPERKLAPVLGINDLSQGSRGIVSLEERNRFGIAGHMITNSKDFILPMIDTKTGNSLTYNLEPFVPMISAGNKGTPSPPMINFLFPSGQLAVEVIKPDGSVSTIGPSPFKGPFYQAISSLSGSPLSARSNNPTQFYGLTTLDKAFNVNFDQYGLHNIRLIGTISDVLGNEYSVSGNYEVWIAKSLDLEEGVFANTPFEVNDKFSPTLVVQPGVPAVVTIDVTHIPFSNQEDKTVTTLTGIANSYGYFSNSEQLIEFTQPGEYRVDYTATYVDELGELWMGSSTWGSIIETPGAQVVTHGSRGFDGGPLSTPNSQWLFLTDDSEVGSHLEFPYQSGDVMWMEEFTNEPRNIADVPAATLQDLNGELVSLLQPRAESHNLQRQAGAITASFDTASSIGEIPLFSSSATTISPAWIEADTNYWAYSYTGAARPGVRVREMIAESNFQNGYWRFDDSYNYQLGNGYNGDLTNDFKFQFVGTVVRAPSENYYYYGAYGSLFVLLPDSEPIGGRVTPPFQGASGGPDGGPLFTLKGEAIDMFFHLTGVRPGSILETGDTAVFSGQLAPTLPGLINITITSPSGSIVQISGMANKIGYFYQPSSNFIADEAGVWQVKVSVTYDGETSSGPVEPPYPTGNVLGSDNGEFSFYVVNKYTQRIPISIARESLTAPAHGAITIDLNTPAGFTVSNVSQTTMMPGFLLESSENNSLSYSYNASALHESFPNLDLTDIDGRTGADTITMSFLLSGTDSEGQTSFLARQLLLQGETLYALEPNYNLVLNNEIKLNADNFGAGDPLDVDLTVQKTGSSETDIYFAIQLPDQSFVTLIADPFTISDSNQVLKFVSGEDRIGELSYSVLDTSLPENLPSGKYKLYAIVTLADKNVMDPVNWLSISEKSFLLN